MNQQSPDPPGARGKLARAANSREGPLGFFWPRSHFCTVEGLVLRYAANTAWLALFWVRRRLICAIQESGHRSFMLCRFGMMGVLD